MKYVHIISFFFTNTFHYIRDFRVSTKTLHIILFFCMYKSKVSHNLVVSVELVIYLATHTQPPLNLILHLGLHH